MTNFILLILSELNSIHSSTKLEEIFGTKEIEVIKGIFGFCEALIKPETNEEEDRMKFTWAANNVLNFLPEKHPDLSPRLEDSEKFIPTTHNSHFNIG